MHCKTALIILDGVGINPEKRGNALVQAKTPFIDQLLDQYPKALLKASGQEVGLPWGEVGNSEVGHSGIGLGRVILQDLPQIDRSIADGTFQNKKIIRASCEVLNNLNSNLHLISLLSDGAVHSHLRHTLALYNTFKTKVSPNNIFLHIIADGRDAGEKSIQKYIDQLKKEIGNEIKFASLSGRFYAMDRDKNWDRTTQAYDAILGKSQCNLAISSAIKAAYAKGETDEFITPVSLSDCPKTNLDYDIFIFTNYRADRSVQLTRAFVDSGVSEIKTQGIARNFITMTTYSEDLDVQVMFSNIELNNPSTNPLTNPFAQVLSQNQITQAHIAETEKFAHVTYFFSGGIMKQQRLENDILIESSKLRSYDKMPQMKAAEISSAIAQSAKKGTGFILANYANGDMVGHSGNLEATIKAVQILDLNLSKTLPFLLENGYTIYLTADHGNCEEMIDLKSGRPNKEHSLNPVPFVYISQSHNMRTIGRDEFIVSEPIGVLADIAPTIIEDLGLRKPNEMTGLNLKKSLL